MKKEIWTIGDKDKNYITSDSRENAIKLLFENTDNKFDKINSVWRNIELLSTFIDVSYSDEEWLETLSGCVTDEQLNHLGFTIKMEIIEE